VPQRIPTQHLGDSMRGRAVQPHTATCSARMSRTCGQRATPEDLCATRAVKGVHARAKVTHTLRKSEHAP
jgi:hypothetical protein